MTLADIAFVLKTGTLQLGSAALQVTEAVAAGLVMAAVAALAAREVIRMAREKRRPRKLRLIALHPPAGTWADREEDEQPAPEPCPWCTDKAFPDETKCTCEEPCERGYCKARPVTEVTSA